MPQLKNRGPLLVDKVRGYFDRLPPWLRDRVTFRIEKQKVDAKIDDVDPFALESELRQEVTDEKLRTNRFLGDGEPGSGNDMGELPASHVSEIVLPNTGQVADVTETVSAAEDHLVEGPPLQDGQSEQVGNVWVKKEVTAPTFDDKSYQLQREDLIPVEFRALVPEKTEAHTINGNATLPTLGAGELVRREEQKKVGVKSVTVQSRDMTTPPVITGQKIDPQWNGAIVNLEQKIVPANTTITQAFGTTDASIKPIDGTNALQETWKAVGATFPAIVLRKFDAELQQQVQEYLQIVPQGSAYVADPDDIDYEDKQIDAVHSMRRTERAPVLATYTTYTTQMITFPAILSYISFALVSLATANRKEPQWVAGVRASFTTPTVVTNNTAFFRTNPGTETLFTWAPTDVIFKGLSYSINLSNVLTDTWSNIGVTYSADAYYGSTVDRFSISATTPSASAYTAVIGNTAYLSSVVDRYKGLWVRKTSIITLR